MKKILVFTFLLISPILFFSVKEKPLKVIVCAGQSNMVGVRSVVDSLPEELKGEIDNSFVFNGKKWIPLEAGRSQAKGFGPEISLAKNLSEKLNEPIGIVKLSIGGTNLDVQWSPNDKASLFYKLVQKVNNSKKNRDIEVIAMIWMQGERDSRSEEMANNYSENLKNLISAARKEFNNPNMYFIAGRVNPKIDRYPFVNEVRKAQENCELKNYSFISCDDLEKGADSLHYNTKGIVEMGNKFSNELLKIMSK